MFSILNNIDLHFLAKILPYLDHIAINDKVTACDMKRVPLS